MSEKLMIGVESIKLGAVGSNGAMGSSLAEYGKVYRDTCTLEQESGTATEYFHESDLKPFISTKKEGVKRLRWSITDFTAATLEMLMGGEDATGTWKAGTSAESIILSIKVTTANGAIIDLAKTRIKAKFNAPLTRNDVGRIDVEATILTPTGNAAAPSIKITPVS